MALPGPRAPAPRSDHLERVVHQLEARGDRRALIRIVERWIASGSPPQAVRLAQARAFLELGLMDRAWLRLKELTEEDPDDLEAQVLTARMFIERGWPARARRLLKGALEREPQRSELQALLARAHEPPLQPPSNARDIERTGSIDEQLRVAERFLAAGSRLRAKSILERLRRGQGTTAARAEELLWAVAGDFGGGPADPLLLARELIPQALLDDPNAPVDVDPDELDMDDVTSHGQRLPSAEPGAAPHDPESFPSLFRRLPEELDLNDFTDSDVTIITKMAAPDQLRRAAPAEVTDPGFTEDEDEGDTQVMMVIPQSRSFREQIAMEKAELTERGGKRETRNIREASPGGVVSFEPQTGEVELEDSELEYGDDLPLDRLGGGDLDEDDLLEEEDEDLVVMTRTEAESGPDVEPTGALAEAPIEVLELNPPPRDPSAPVPPPSTTPVTRYLEDSPADFRSPLQRLAPAMLLLVLVLLAGGYLAQRGATALRSGAIYSEVSEAVGRASYRSLLSAEGQLEQFVDDEDSLAAHLAGLAMIKLNLWSDYTGGPERLQAAEALLARARTLDERDALLQLAEGWRLLLLGDYEAAHQVAITLDSADPEVLLLSARAAAGLGNKGEAMELIDRAVALSDSPRYQVQRARICLDTAEPGAAAGGCAQGAIDLALAALPDEAAVQLLALEVTASTQDRGLALPRVESFIAGMDESVPPRVAGEAYFIDYSLLRQGQDTAAADRAMELAVAADPTNPKYLYHHAVDFLSKGQVSSALKSAEACTASRPTEWRYHAVQIWALLELDQVEQASGYLEALPPMLQGDLRFRVLQAAVALNGYDQYQQALTLLDDIALIRDPEAEYLRDLARGRLGEDTSAALLRVSEKLAASEDPLLQVFAPRARGAALLFGDPAQPYLLEESASLSPSLDPMVQLLLAEAWETHGDRRRAAILFDRAASLGEGPAIAHYLRGQFYNDGEHPATTASAWRRYLEQDPSGARAERARKRLHR